MKTSARNQLAGSIKRIETGGLHSRVLLELSNGQEITAMLPRDRAESLGLVAGETVLALVKSTSIVIATDLEHVKLSSSNQLRGMIAHVERGAVNSIVTLDLGGGLSVNAGITMQSTEQLDLHPGQYATAVFQAESVILGVLV